MSSQKTALVVIDPDAAGASDGLFGVMAAMYGAGGCVSYGLRFGLGAESGESTESGEGGRSARSEEGDESGDDGAPSGLPFGWLPPVDAGRHRPDSPVPWGAGVSPEATEAVAPATRRPRSVDAAAVRAEAGWSDPAPADPPAGGRPAIDMTRSASGEPSSVADRTPIAPPWAEDAGTRGHEHRGGVFDYEIRPDAIGRYDVLAATDCVAALHREHRFDAILVPATPFGRMLAPRVAMRLHVGLVADVTGIRRRGDEIEMVRPAFSGKMMAHVVKVGDGPVMMTIRPRTFASEDRPRKNTEILPYSAPGGSRPGPRLIERRPHPDARDIRESDVLVSGGGGVRRSFDQLKALADALGGLVSASRKVVDSGVAGRHVQVGQSGRTVSPELYIAIGISGSIQHVVGLRNARHVIAVNLDPNAPICALSDIVVEGDAHEFVPRLVARIQEGSTASASDASAEPVGVDASAGVDADVSVDAHAPGVAVAPGGSRSTRTLATRSADAGRSLCAVDTVDVPADASRTIDVPAVDAGSSAAVPARDAADDPGGPSGRGAAEKRPAVAVDAADLPSGARDCVDGRNPSASTRRSPPDRSHRGSAASPTATTGEE